VTASSRLAATLRRTAARWVEVACEGGVSDTSVTVGSTTSVGTAVARAASRV